MDSDDTGFFVYDSAYPPICVRPPPELASEYKEPMDGTVTAYLQESYREGTKHEDAVLSNGLTAGEAGVLYFRELKCKRRKCERTNPDISRVMEYVRHALHKHMGISFSDTTYDAVFNRHITPDIFTTKQYKRVLTPAIKLFLKEINMKTKGYTSKLRNVISDIILCIETDRAPTAT